MKGNSFVMYRSFYNNFLKVKKDFGNEKALAYIEAILNFGFTGETPDEDSILWAFGLETMFNNIDASISRYERAEASGGGRPGIAIEAEQIYEQMALHNTWKEVAHALGIDEDTLRKLRNNYNITERSPRNYRKTEKPNSDNFSVNSNQGPVKTTSITQNSENRKTEKSRTEKPNASVFGNTEVFRSQIKTTTILETQNRKTEKPRNRTEIPKNLNYNVNQNQNFNSNNNLVSCAQNENSDKNREEKKPNGIRFFPDDEIKTEKIEKCHEQKTESFSAFSDTIIKTEKPKNSNTTFSDNLEQKDDDKNEPMTAEQIQWLRDRGYNV